MTKYEINKFPPALFRHGRFLREDWTACTDIGRTTQNGVLDKNEYSSLNSSTEAGCNCLSAAETLPGLRSPRRAACVELELELAGGPVATDCRDDVGVRLIRLGLPQNQQVCVLGAAVRSRVVGLVRRVRQARYVARRMARDRAFRVVP